MSIDIDTAAITEMGDDPTGPVAIIIERYAVETETIAKLLLQVPGTGRVYTPGEYFLTRNGKVYHWTRTGTHQASAPGEPPATDTGFLSASLEHQLVQENGKIVGKVRARAFYGLFLELGTRYMAPRPFLRPALHAAVH